MTPFPFLPNCIVHLVLSLYFIHFTDWKQLFLTIHPHHKNQFYLPHTSFLASITEGMKVKVGQQFMHSLPRSRKLV